MTETEKIAKTARLTGKSKDADNMMIIDYLDIARHEIMERCYPFGYSDDELMPSRYDYLQCEIAVYLINKEGAEGQTSHSENGVSRSYETGGIPESFLRQITPRGVIY